MRVSDILRIALPVLCAIGLAIAIGAAGRFRAERDASRASVWAFIERARAATEKARRADLENTNRVRAEQDAISRKVVTDYEEQLAAVRARADRLRRDAAAATAADRRGSAAVPGTGDAAATLGASTGEGRLPPLSDDDALIATEQALQLTALIDWVEAQSAVEPNQ